MSNPDDEKNTSDPKRQIGPGPKYNVAKQKYALMRQKQTGAPAVPAIDTDRNIVAKTINDKIEFSENGGAPPPNNNDTNNNTDTDFEEVGRPDVEKLHKLYKRMAWFQKRFGVDYFELKHLLQFYPDPELHSRAKVILIGILASPISFAGMLIGYVRGYNRFMRGDRQLPAFADMKPILKVAMAIGAVVAWLVVLAAAGLLVAGGWFTFHSGPKGQILIAYLTISAIGCGFLWGLFYLWHVGRNNAIVEGERFGSARFAEQDELQPYDRPKGIYIGDGYRYEKQGHIITTAGSRSGKFVNLIAPNLLGYGVIDGSWFVVDPKGEVCAVTSDYQRQSGRKVVVINPWAVLGERLPAGQCFNPMDILDAHSSHLVDDCYMLAEMLVPIETGRNKFFSDSARSVISGFLLYIAISEMGHNRSLKTLWKWVRYPQAMWDRVLGEMQNYKDGLDPNSDNLLYAATEIEKLSKSGSNTWGSILSSVLQATDFLKSPILQTAMESGFNPARLAEGNITLYMIIPADKLQSHSRWMRLVVTSCMRAVIRKPKKRVVFILDEFASLGYLPEIETALSTYAGFNVTVWPILQSLVQLQNIYDKNWEVFIGNTAVKHYFGIHNNFDAEYVSKAIGKKSHVITTRAWFGAKDAEANARDLITPDELRVASGSKIFTFIDDIPPAILSKIPYHTVKILDDRAGENPYLM